MKTKREQWKFRKSIEHKYKNILCIFVNDIEMVNEEGKTKTRNIINKILTYLFISMIRCLNRLMSVFFTVSILSKVSSTFTKIRRTEITKARKVREGGGCDEESEKKINKQIERKSLSWISF